MTERSASRLMMQGYARGSRRLGTTTRQKKDAYFSSTLAVEEMPTGGTSTALLFAAQVSQNGYMYTG